MKRIFYTLFAFAFALSASSCVREMLEEPALADEYDGFPVSLFVQDNEWTAGDGVRTAYTPGEGVSIDGTENLGLYYFNSKDNKYYGKTEVERNSSAVIAKPTDTKGIYSMLAPAASAGYTWFAIMPYSNYLNKNLILTTDSKSYLATKLPSIQYPKANSFDPMCDIMVAKPFTLAGTDEQTGTITGFKRLSAPLRMNVTGLADDEKIYAATLAFSQKPVVTAGPVSALAGHFVLNTGMTPDEVGINSLFTGASAENSVSAVYSEALVKQGDSWPVWFSVMPVTFKTGCKMTLTVTTRNAVITREVTLPSNMEIKSGMINEFAFNIKGEGFESEEAITQDFINNGLGGKTTSTPSLTASDGNAYTWGYTNVTPWTGSAKDGGSGLSSALNLHWSDTPALTFPAVAPDREIIKARIFMHPLTMASTSGVTVTLKNGEETLKEYTKFSMLTSCADYVGAGIFDITLPAGTSTLEGTSIHISGATAASTFFPISRVVLFTSDGKSQDTDFDFLFTDGKSFQWPFYSPSVTELASKMADVKPMEEETYLSFKNGDTDYDVTLFASGGICKNSTSGFGMSVQSGDYMVFPQVEGLYLTSVTIIPAKTTKPGINAMRIVNTMGEEVGGGAEVNTFTADTPVTWTLLGSSVDDQYMFEFTNAARNWTWIKRLTLHYSQGAPVVDSFDIDINCYPGGTRAWPFISPAQADVPARAADASKVAGPATFTYNTPMGVMSSPVYTTNGYLTNSLAGFLFGNAAGDYFGIPAVENLYLTEVILNIGNDNHTNGCPCICKEDGSQLLGGGPFSHKGARDEEYKWTLYDTKAGTPYRLALSVGGANMGVRRLRMHYSKEPLPDPSSDFQEVKEDEIPDFSMVGYHYGDREIPEIPTKITLTAPSDGSDCTAMIQNAIDNVQTPGAVLLKAGTYNVKGQILINRSGVVLRGEGTSTIIKSTNRGVAIDGGVEWGTTGYLSAVVRVGNASYRTIGTGSDIIAKYVPAGQDWVPVINPEKFSVGETVAVFRRASAEWIRAIKMDVMKNNIAPEDQWKPSDFNSMYWERKIVKIEGYKLYFDAPIVMGIGLWGTSGVVYKCASNRPSEIGVENIKFDTVYDSSKTASSSYGREYIDEKHTQSAVEFISADNSWVKGVTSTHFCVSCVALRAGAIRCTVSGCTSLSPVSEILGSRRYGFTFNGCQLCIVKDCSCDHDRHAFLTNARVPGPNVFLRGTTTNTLTEVGPHGLWATGTLFDNISVKGTAETAFLDCIDRSCYDGVAQGWAGANTVFYNCDAQKGICIQQPWVSAKSWCIGCVGPWADQVKPYKWDDYGPRPAGVKTSFGTKVSPASLYEDQLQKRHQAGNYLDK